MAKAVRRNYSRAEQKSIKSFINSLKILDGIIVYNNFEIDENVPFEKQRYSYKEDILQIEYGDRFTLDAGWYPEFQPNGYFVVYAIQDEDWENPLSKTKCCTLAELKRAIEKAALLIDSKKKIKDLPFRHVEYEELD